MCVPFARANLIGFLARRRRGLDLDLGLSLGLDFVLSFPSGFGPNPPAPDAGGTFFMRRRLNADTRLPIAATR